MKQSLITILGISLLSICLAACGWKPEVTAVPVTAPWSAMNLPIQENAVVFRSNPDEFRAVHKDDKRAVMKKYTDVLRTQGWAPADFEESGDRFLVDMEKGGEQIRLEFYDFDNTGVAIKKK